MNMETETATAKKSTVKNVVVLLDDDGNHTKAGDVVRFTYGLAPVVVYAKIVQRRGQLIALTPGHDPVECNLRSLRHYVGDWYKQST